MAHGERQGQVKKKKRKKKVQQIPACLTSSPHRFDHLLQVRCNEFRVLHAWQSEFFSHLAAQLTCTQRSERDSSTLHTSDLLVHALLIRLFFSFFSFLLR